ncbi:MAG: FHA domain-containing protein [Deltaproteobacteria bacterium]|nr:FHA domain-containing protein [Deltaproteobacteria bacterium]
MSDPSRFFYLRDERLRRSEPDSGTMIGLRPQIGDGTHQSLDAKKLFVDHYASIRAALERHRRLGLAVLAFDGSHSAPLAGGWLAASLDRSRSAIVGRHSACPIVIPGDHQSLSLRHLLILVRAASHDSIRIRVVDLHTGLGFADESGRLLQAVRIEGSAFLTIGSIHLALLMTGEGAPPASAEEAYACVPERVFFDEAPGPFAPNPRQRPRGVAAALPAIPAIPAEGTHVLSMPGPISATSRLLEDGEAPFARMTLFGRELQVPKDLGASALERGVMLGRYSRCDVRTGADSDNVSRVHVLLLKDGDDVLAIDAGSSNGTWYEGREISTHRLKDGDLLDLGGAGDLGIFWEPSA